MGQWLGNLHYTIHMSKLHAFVIVMDLRIGRLK